MDISTIVAKLHPLERAILPALNTYSSLQIIAKASKLGETETMRALQWLENKGALTIHSTATQQVVLEKNGVLYQKQGLPERRFLEALGETAKGLNVITKKAKLSREEMEVSLGILRKKSAISLRKEGDLLLATVTPSGKKLLEEGFPEEAWLSQHFPLAMSTIQNQSILGEFQKRKEIISIQEKKEMTVTLTELGKQLAQADLKGTVINRLTTAMLRDGSWQDQHFRSYDVEINVPRISGGKKHFVEQAIEYAKQAWIEMGFKEMTGNMVNTSFWNFDALFVPQDHPAREMQDTFFLGGVAEKGKLPSPKIVENVKRAHEQGTPGSLGWQYPWNPEEARRNVLRTHTTVLTALTLASLQRKDLPAKFFALGKNFRNEALDWKHLFEFNQTDGIVVDKDANFRHMLGYLKQFFAKMGFPQARFRPAYFPYTEPSVEIDVFHAEKKEWVEFGGAGMLRPEVVVALLGEDIPVLAWGPGFDRTILEYYNITDIRDLYKNDIQQLQGMKVWLK